MNGSERITAIDWIKAIAIVAVVVTHAGELPWPATFGLERLIRGRLVIFHVASFFVIAGFLAADAEVLTARALRERLFRIVPPYLLASAAVFAFGLNVPRDFSGALFMLGTGSTLGIYYFVFNLVVSFLMVFLLTQISSKLVAYALGAFLLWWAIAPFAVDALPNPSGVPSYWTFRDPTRYFPYFAGGWLARLNLAALQRMWSRYDRPLVAIAIVAAVTYVVVAEAVILTPAGIPARGVYVLAFLAITIFCTKRSSGNEVIRFLSESSYTIYLYHLFFMLPVLPYFTSTPPPGRILALTILGLAGASAVALVGRIMLGGRSRILVGT